MRGSRRTAKSDRSKAALVIDHVRFLDPADRRDPQRRSELGTTTLVLSRPQGRAHPTAVSGSVFHAVRREFQPPRSHHKPSHSSEKCSRLSSTPRTTFLESPPVSHHGVTRAIWSNPMKHSFSTSCESTRNLTNHDVCIWLR